MLIEPVQINKSGTVLFVEISNDNEIEEASKLECRVVFCWNSQTGILTCVVRERNNNKFSPTPRSLTKREALNWAQGMARTYD